jgi:hypothetical protein
MFSLSSPVSSEMRRIERCGGSVSLFAVNEAYVDIMYGCMKKSLYKISNVAFICSAGLFAQQYLYLGLVYSWQFFSVSASEQKIPAFSC